MLVGETMQLRNFKLFHMALLILLAAPVAGRADFTTGDPHVYEVRQRLHLVKQGGTVENFKLEVPAFLQDNLPPYQRVLTFTANLSELKMVNSETEPTIEYRLSRWSRPRELVVELGYTIENRTITYEIARYMGQNSVAARYLQPEPGIESQAPALVNLAAVLCAKEAYPLDKALKLFNGVNSKIHYQTNVAGEHSALRTLKRGYGNCEDYSLLYIALCRAAGIPARFVNGFRFDPAQLGSNTKDLNGFGHAWVEVNLPGVGWFPAEPTYTYLVNGVPRISDDFFGKIRGDDRHLLFNYSRNGGYRCSWSHDERIKVTIKVENRMTIRRVR
jgi:transglutaminase-like putative cysteine protease